MAVYDPHDKVRPLDPFHPTQEPKGNHCPRCGSTNIRHDVEGDVVGAITAILPGPPNIPGINYVCKDCGHRYMWVK